jgi:type VII secretion-associated serine protease mycosin
MPQPSTTCPRRRGRKHLTSVPWAQQVLGFSTVWNLTKGKGITVAVVDSGIDYTPQLARRVTHIDVTGGNGQDCVPHGTIVASIIAARDQGKLFYGVAPEADILSIRVQVYRNAAGQAPARIADGILDAVAAHAKVINVSIQVNKDYPPIRSAISVALKNDIVVVAAAGNDGVSGPGPFYPAAYRGVLSVNAVDQSGQLAGFDVGRTPVSVTAPGVNLAGDCPAGFCTGVRGTSFAAAFVSGEAALVRSFYPKLTAKQVVDRIMATADGGTGPHTGAGMINPVLAVTEMLPPRPNTGARSPGPVAVPQPRAVDSFTHTVAFSVTGGAFALAALAAIAAVVVPQGRRRRWRPGRLGPDAAPAMAEPPASPQRPARPSAKRRRLPRQPAAARPRRAQAPRAPSQPPTPSQALQGPSQAPRPSQATAPGQAPPSSQAAGPPSHATAPAQTPPASQAPRPDQATASGQALTPSQAPLAGQLPMPSQSSVADQAGTASQAGTGSQPRTPSRPPAATQPAPSRPPRARHRRPRG